jgi:hypothetical protein
MRRSRRLPVGLSGAPEGRNMLCSPNAEHKVLRTAIFSLSISFFFALLASYFSGLAAFFPPSFFSTVIFLYSHNNT